ncbi:MAG: DUF554 domain-containing protein [Syntrophomonadaceae bacterium]|nr:DUF554 domain-containing protein [Syntrophomonadaceae bacterium]
MTGTIINVAAIVGAGLIGLFLRKGIPDQMSNSIKDGLGLLVAIIGIQYALGAESYAVIGISIALGAIVGEWGRLEDRLNSLGGKLENLLSMGESQFVKGFVSATLLFCVGAMAIVGSLEDGLTGNYQILLIKSILDGIFSLLFTASMGVGVIFSAVPVLLYQGVITLAAGIINPFLSDSMMNNITALGGVLITGLGMNIAGITRFRIANLLPGILLVPLVMLVVNLLPL